MFDKNILYNELVEQVGILLNSVHPDMDLKKLVTLEFTLNMETANMEYNEVLGIVIGRLIAFYDCQKLEDLWTQYLIYESVESMEEFDKVS
jgi:hypothetical protein